MDSMRLSGILGLKDKASQDPVSIPEWPRCSELLSVDRQTACVRKNVPLDPASNLVVSGVQIRFYDIACWESCVQRYERRKMRNAEPKSAKDLIAGMSRDSRTLLERAQNLADCKVRTADGFEFELHKMTLTQESVVLG